MHLEMLPLHVTYLSTMELLRELPEGHPLHMEISRIHREYAEIRRSGPRLNMAGHQLAIAGLLWVRTCSLVLAGLTSGPMGEA